MRLALWFLLRGGRLWAFRTLATSFNALQRVVLDTLGSLHASNTSLLVARGFLVTWRWICRRCRALIFWYFDWTRFFRPLSLFGTISFDRRWSVERHFGNIQCRLALWKQLHNFVFFSRLEITHFTHLYCRVVCCIITLDSVFWKLTHIWRCFSWFTDNASSLAFLTCPLRHGEQLGHYGTCCIYFNKTHTYKIRLYTYLHNKFGHSVCTKFGSV